MVTLVKAMVVYTEPVGNAESFVVTATIDGRQGCCGMCFRLINTKLIFGATDNVQFSNFSSEII